MKKALKIIGIVIAVILILEILAVLGCICYHRFMLSKEKPLVETPLGQLVEVDGHNMSIYTEGKGAHTLVFLSGWGVASPILDFRSLYSKLTDEYRIVVIEKFGYGFSDDVDSERSFDTILRQDREALSKAGIEGPYILCPHSLSGLEALYWAQSYPDEVEAVVGLDMSLPPNCDEADQAEMKDSYLLNKWFNRLGFFRMMNVDGMIDALHAGTLTDEEKAIYRALIYANTGNAAPGNETADTVHIAEVIESSPAPDIPMLLFIMDKKTEAQTYASGTLGAKVIPLDCGHYVHILKTDTVSEEMRTFIGNLS
ncbi:MAG: alpha/beta hydrolase [Oscillospiraceae bacterium]|nr:alpha/beta hydrolase [Oscillospiraceae bacterium]